jgi:hypothetical protein
MEVGRCLMERRVRWRDDWWEGLRLHVEVWDGRDGLRMLSVEGQLGVKVENAYGVVRVTGPDRREVVGPAFSAASRNSEHHRFDDIKDYFNRAHEEGMPARLCTRMVVRDVRSGRRALLWESGKRQARVGHWWNAPPNGHLALTLPAPGNLRCRHSSSQREGHRCSQLRYRGGGTQDDARLLRAARGRAGGGAGTKQAVAAGGG